MIKNRGTFLLTVLLLTSLSSCNNNPTKMMVTASANQKSSPSSQLCISNSKRSSSDPIRSSADTSQNSTAVPNIQTTKYCTSNKVLNNNKAAGASAIITRSEVDGVKGTFVDPNIVERKRNLNGKYFALATFWTNEYSPAVIKNIERDYNCHISIKSLSLNSYENSIKSTMAAGKVYADIFDTQLEMKNLIEDNDFADLQNVKNIGLKTNDWNPVFTLESSYKGGVYGVQIQQDNINRTVCFFNKTLADKYGIDVYNLVDKSRWNFKAFNDLSAKVYSQSKGNIYGSAMINQTYITSFIYANATAPVVNKNGKYIFNGTDNKVLSALDYLNRYVKSGYYNTSMSNDNSQSTQAFENGKMLFFIADLWERSNLKRNMIDKFGVVPLPMGPNASSYISLISNARYFSISRGNPDMEDCGSLITALAKRMYTPYSKWIKNLSSSTDDQQSVEMIKRIITLKQVLFSSGLTDGNNGNAFESAFEKAVFLSSESSKEAMQDIAATEQHNINKYYGQ